MRYFVAHLKETPTMKGLRKMNGQDYGMKLYLSTGATQNKK